MRYLCAALLVILMAGCGTSSAAQHVTATPAATTRPPVPHATRPVPTPTPTVIVGKPFASFLGTVCHALAVGDAGTIISLLPYYQYDNGLRYAILGRGGGQTVDPGLMRSWLATARPRCVSFSPGVMGHGTVLTVGWKTPSPASLIDLDMYGGRWKINDFTFAGRTALQQAIHTAGPVLSFRT